MEFNELYKTLVMSLLKVWISEINACKIFDLHNTTQYSILLNTLL